MAKPYVLIDFENVQPESLEWLTDEAFKVVVFVGAKQAKLPLELAVAMQRMGSRAEYVRISGNGPNALDFHIAYYIGKLAAGDSKAWFHIVSNDAGFDPLIEHLKSKKIRVRRITTIEGLPLPRVCCSKQVDPKARHNLIVNCLQANTKSRPGTEKTLRGTIAATFQKTLSEKEITDIVQSLTDRGLVKVVGEKVTYALPSR